MPQPKQKVSRMGESREKHSTGSLSSLTLTISIAVGQFPLSQDCHEQRQRSVSANS